MRDRGETAEPEDCMREFWMAASLLSLAGARLRPTILAVPLVIVLFGRPA